MARQDQATQPGLGGGGGSHLQCQIESRSLPRHPTELAAEHLGGETLGVGRGGNGDHRVGVHVVDVGVGEKRMGWRFDAGGSRVQVERTVPEQLGHFILLPDAAIAAFECEYLVEIGSREAVDSHRPKVTAGPLDPQHLHGLAGERIRPLRASRTCCRRQSS